MPDEPKPDSSLERWADKILRWLTPLILAYIATMATQNGNRNEEIDRKVDQVHTGQQAAAETTQVVKENLDKRAVALEARAAEDAKATAINLYGTWRYLSDYAVTPEEKAKAAEAKVAYDEFVKKSQPKK